jgi:hypothetical protein
VSKNQDLDGYHWGQLDRSWATNKNITHLQLRIGLLMASDVDKYQHTPQRLADRLQADVKAVRTAINGLVERGLIERLEGKEGGGRGADLMLHWPPLDLDDEDDAPSDVDIMLGRSPIGRRASDPGSQTPGPTPPPSSSGQSSKAVAQKSSESLRDSSSREEAPSAKANRPKQARNRTAPTATTWTDRFLDDDYPVLAAYRDGITAGNHKIPADQDVIAASLDEATEKHGVQGALAFVAHVLSDSDYPHRSKAVATFLARWTPDGQKGHSGAQSERDRIIARNRAQAAEEAAKKAQRDAQPVVELTPEQVAESRQRLQAMRDSLLARRTA